MTHPAHRNSNCRVIGCAACKNQRFWNKRDKMTLKEKLAKDWVIPYPVGHPANIINIINLAFIAGFNKARQMAAEIAYGSGFDGTGDEIDYIGEEEVK